MSQGPVRHIRLRAVVAYPAVALVAALALAITPFSSAQGMTLAVLPTPTDTLTAAAVPTTADATTAAPTSLPTTDAPTSAPMTVAPTTVAPTTVAPVPNPTPGVDPSLAPTVAVPVAQHVLARVEDAGLEASYLAVDAPVLDGSQFQTFRVRFQLRNDGTAPITQTPQLEYRADGAAAFAAVPDVPKLGSPLHVAQEWVPSVGGGTKQGPLEEDIVAADFKMPLPAGEAVVGHHSMGANPDVPITIPAASFTELEFTVQLSMDAKYLTGYELQITDAGTALPGTQVARIVLGPPPALQLSAGQRQGVVVVDPPAANAAGAVYSLLAAPTTAPTAAATTPADTTLAAAVPASEPAGAPLYALDAAAVTPVAVPIINPAADPSTDSHDIGSAQCGTCHRGHTGKAPDLTKESQQSTLCFSCHNGTGGKDVQSQYALTRPVNNASSREYFSHDAVDTTTTTRHTLDVNEFAGVENRHSECADCHNSHKAGSTNSVQMADGWTASGRLAGVSGVKVLNGAAGSAPTYTLLSGLDTDFVPANAATREYQVCFKCHSGYTTLLPNIAGKPSTDALDKAKELNPANPSFHPVEAAGTNQTTKMADSLAGTSPYKLWNFNTTSTVRCLNCHAGGATEPLATPTALPLPGSSLQPHTSSNRGILLENYLDRELKPRADTATLTAAYSAGDFALCYVCHAEAPFTNETANATNFRLHGKHISGLEGKGDGGTDIDKAGDGQGNATCAECHFRIHSTTNKVGAQVIPGTRLVNFAPNVLPDVTGGTLSWAAGATGSGSCTLTCHGYKHTNKDY